MATRKQKSEDGGHHAHDDGKLSKEEHRRQAKRMYIGTALAILFMAIITALVFMGYINLSGRVKDSQLWEASYNHRLEFAMRYQLIGVTWIMFCMFYVISKRFNTKAVNPLSGREDITLRARNIMNNSVEQFLLSFFAQIISLSYLDEQTLLKVIPLVNLLFLIGRITYFFGYPHNRTFGFLFSSAPTVSLLIFNWVMFVKYFC